MTLPACTLNPEMWFADPSGKWVGTGAQCDEAMALCRDCPILTECREEADGLEGTSRDLRHLFGVWAGETPSMRLARRGITPYGLPENDEAVA